MKLVKRDPECGYLDSNLWVPKTLINVDGVKRALEFELPGHESIRCVRLWQEAEHHLIVPRAFWKPEDFTFKCIDCRPRQYVRTNVRSKVQLDCKPGPGGLLMPTGKDLQQRAVAALLKSNGGTLQLGCGRGKTVIALHFAAQKRVPTLIAVDNTQLLHQWQEQIATHLFVPGGVGLVQGPTKDWRKEIVMATYHTLANWADTMPEEVRQWFGLVVWDEGHHVNAPTFSKSAPLFYGYRLALTATPERADGMHVICQHHVGDIIFKDIIQDYPPRISFRWTGFSIDLEDEDTKRATCDVNSELHLRKLAGYLGSNRERLTQVVIPTVQALVKQGHKVIVLSYSVNEVINLMTLWTAKDDAVPLYTNIPYPTSAEVGEVLPPLELSKAYVGKCQHTLHEITKHLARFGKTLPEDKRKAFEARARMYQEQLAQYAVWKKTESLYHKRQREFLANLLAKPSTSGLFTEAVKPRDRAHMLATRQVVFAIMKYGKEGLDDKNLSAVVVCEPMSDRNMLQQIMGRPRDKKNAELVFLEDNVAPLIGQCQKLRRHLRQWPVDEGGPFKYTLINHPSVSRRGAPSCNQILPSMQQLSLPLNGT